MRQGACVIGVVVLLGLCPGAGKPASVPADCPSAAIGYTALASSALSTPSGAEVATRESTLAACFATLDIERFRIGFGMDYAYTRYEYDGIAGRDRDLHRLQLPVTLGVDGNDWRLDGVLAPGVATSSNVFKDLGTRGSGDDFFLAARVEGRKRRAGGGAWLLGLVHDRSFGESRTWPVAGVEWQPTDRTAVRLAWPDPGLAIHLSGRQSVVVDLFPAGQRWHVVSEELGAAFDYRMEAWRARVTWSYRIAGSLTLDFVVGREFEREHAFTDDTGRPIRAEADDQWLAAIGFRFGPGARPGGSGPTSPAVPPSTRSAGPANLNP